MNTHNNIRNPARVSCSTSPCIWRPFRPGAAPSVPVTPSAHIGNVTILGRWFTRAKPAAWRWAGSVNGADDLRVPKTDPVAVGQLPLLHRCVVDGGAVRGVEVGKERDLSIPADLQVAPRHASVGQPELGILSATHDVGTLAQLVGPAAAVIELQGDRSSGGPIATLPVTAVATGLPVVTGAA